MATWDMFRAVAARLGLSRETVEAVERRGEPTFVTDPRNPNIQYRVRPDPDWTQRMTDAWFGELVNSRQESAGTVPVTYGLLLLDSADKVATPDSPDREIVGVVAGDYEIVLTIAHQGAEERGSYEEHVSHVWALLGSQDDVALIEPMKTPDGAERWIGSGKVMFAGMGVPERLAADHPGEGLWHIVNLLNPSVPATQGQRWRRITTKDGAGALTTVSGGHGGWPYPLFRMTDSAGRTIGILIDFYVDNRPYDY